MKWVVTANTNHCKIYHYQRKEGVLTLVKEIAHPENKLRDIDITSDKPGHYKTNHTARGAYTQETDPKEALIDNFAKEIAKTLEVGRNEQAYEQLFFMIPAQMNGLIQKHLDKHVTPYIKENHQKNVMSLSPKELVAYLKAQ